MDLVLIAQIVRVVIASMPNIVALIALIAPAVSIPLTTLIVPTAIDSDSVIALVRTVKSMRELRCEPFLGEHDVEIASRWMRRVENTMTQMKVSKDWRGNCAIQLLMDIA